MKSRILNAGDDIIEPSWGVDTSSVGSFKSVDESVVVNICKFERIFE